MKRALSALTFAVTTIAILSGCSSASSRNPASQDSPEIQQKMLAELNASPLLPGDRIVFNEERRFEVGSNKMRLGNASGFSSTSSCALIVEPPRGERVQNYVPVGKVLTISGIRAVQKGRTPVALRGYSKSRDDVKALVGGLSERGYDTSKIKIQSSKSLYESAAGQPSIVAYDLTGSTLKSTLECEIVASSYSAVSIYDAKDFATLDKSNGAIQRAMTVGEMKTMTGAEQYYYEKPPMVFEPIKRNATEYRKMPINFVVPVRIFEDIRQNSI